MSASEAMLSNPVAEIASEIDCVCALKLAGTMLLFHEFSNEIVANERSEVCIANSCVFSLRDEDVLFFLL